MTCRSVLNLGTQKTNHPNNKLSSMRHGCLSPANHRAPPSATLVAFFSVHPHSRIEAVDQEAVQETQFMHSNPDCMCLHFVHGPEHRQVHARSVRLKKGVHCIGRQFFLDFFSFEWRMESRRPTSALSPLHIVAEDPGPSGRGLQGKYNVRYDG